MTEFRDLDEELPDWVVPPVPENIHLTGRYVEITPLSVKDHVAELHAANSVDASIWDYLPYGPFKDVDLYAEWVRSVEARPDPYFLAIRNLESGRYEGVASYLRIAPEAGSIETGHINLSKALQKTRAATEAAYLMMRWAFEAGYRRYEWKCNALNHGSRRAAERFGLSYEGIFRQAAVIKGRNRDTAWFAAIDKEWPAIREAFETWLDPSNFDETGAQKRALSELTRPILHAHDPGL